MLSLRPLSFVLCLGLASVVGTGTGRAQSLYGIAYDTGNLYSISTANAAPTLIAPTGMNDLGANPGALTLGADGYLYSFDVPALISFYFRINPATGAATHLTDLYHSQGAHIFDEGALAADSAGSGWGASGTGQGGSRFLFTVSLATGAASAYGPSLSPGSDINGLAFRSDGILVGIDRLTNSLVQIDTATGATTAIAPALGLVGGMAVQDGTAYFCTGGPSAGGTNELYTIDLFTGAIALVGSLGPTITGKGLSGLSGSAGPVFTPFCFGDGSGAACPCANTGIAGRGCQNSAASGGARLVATGRISPDTVVLHVTQEVSTALTIFLQGNATGAPGIPFGDGIRCAAGILVRLYVKNASNGMASAPGSGDPSISARSAALGDPIPPGERRYYQTYYRDPNLSFCPDPPGSTFNASNAIKIQW